MRSPWAWVPLMFAWFVTGCGAPPPAIQESDIDLEGEDEALVGSVCDPAQLDDTLTWTTAWVRNETCSGVWSYIRYGQCSLTDARCGTYCPTFKTCRDWSFGRDPVDQKLVHEQGMTQIPKKCTERCVREFLGVCVDHETTCVVDSAWATNKCTQWAEDYRSFYYNHGHYVGSRVDWSTMTNYQQNPDKTYRGTCRYQLSIPQANNRQGQACGCAVAYAPRTCMLYDARCGQSRTTTALDKTFAQAESLLSTDPAAAPWDSIDGVSAADLTCTTCESAPLPASVSAPNATQLVQAKHDCLVNRRPLATAPAALRTDRNRVYLYERWGELLTPAQRVASRPLYENYANLPGVSACGSDDALPALPAACPGQTATKLAADLRRCQRLSESHVSNALRTLEFTSCTAALDALAATPACKGPGVVEFQAKTVTRMLEAQFALIVQEPAGSGELSRQLTLLDAWYRASTGAGARPSADELERILTLFRLKLNEKYKSFDVLAPALGQNADAIQAALGTAEKNARKMDLDVLTALFTPVSGALPLSGVPLAQIAGDALTSLSSRLTDLASYHDFACSFRACDISSVNSPVLYGVRALSSLDNRDRLQTALSASTQNLSGYKAVFDAVLANHQTLAAALVDPAARDTSLVRVIDLAKAQFGNYEREGRFRGMKSDLLHAGLTASERDAVIAAVRQSANALNNTTTNYDQSLQALFTEVMGELSAGADADRVQGEIEQLALQVDDLAKDLLGLSQNVASDEKRFSRTLIEHSIAAQMNDTTVFQMGEPVFVDLNGASGRYNFNQDPNHQQPVSSVAAAVVPNLLKGQTLMVEASGSYAPTCALRRMSGSILSPNGSAASVGVAGALTGPEGFTLSFSNGSYHAASNTSTESTTIGVRAEVCTGGSTVGFSASACAYASHDWTESSSDSTGEETRTSASFTSGIRLKSTPFPQQAAGALLVVLTDPTTGAVQDVRAVHAPQTAIFVPANTTAYLVVNDETNAACTAPDTSHVLSVTATPMVSGPGAATQLAEAMASVLTTVRGRQGDFLRQGRILPAELEQLRTAAINALSASLHIENFPPVLREIFDEYLTAELVNLQRRVEMLGVERQQKLLLAQIRTLDKVLVNAAANAHLAKQLPQRMLRRLSVRVLEEDVTALEQVVEEYLAPVLALWYPRVTQLLSDSARMNQLLALDLDSEVEDGARAVHDLVEHVLSTVSVAQLGFKGAGSSLPLVAVSFVRPGTPAVNPITGQRQLSNLRKVDAGRAQDLWDAIDGHTRARIQIRPEDLYGSGANRTDFTLSCAEHVPVVYKMAGYFSGNAEDVDGELNGLSRTFDAFPASGQPYATMDGLEPYQLVNDVWTRMDMPILYGTFTAISSVFGADQDVAAQRPVGLSPFATYDLDFSALDAIESNGGLSGVDGKFEFVVLFQVDSRPAGQNLPWVSTCH